MNEISYKSTARATGILYVIIILCAGFAEGYVRSGLIMPGDAAATARNILDSESLYRFGLVSDLVAFMSDAAVSILFYFLLKPVSKTLALVAASLRLLAHPAIAGINLLNHFFPLLLLNGSDYLGVFGSEQLNALVMLFLDVHHTGYLIAGAFFGVHLFILGYLLFRSELFPGILGILIVIASAGYVTESFGTVLVPAYAQLFAWMVGITAVLGEVPLALYLLIKGVKDQPQDETAKI